MLTNMKTVRESNTVTGANIEQPGLFSYGSRSGENNALHVAGAMILIGVLAVGAGILNAKVAVSAGRGS